MGGATSRTTTAAITQPFHDRRRGGGPPAHGGGVCRYSIGAPFFHWADKRSEPLPRRCNMSVRDRLADAWRRRRLSNWSGDELELARRELRERVALLDARRHRAAGRVARLAARHRLAEIEAEIARRRNVNR